MEWYEILFATALMFFIIKTAVSWFAGDFEMDVDFDGNADFDASGAFSFKGLLHFILGFSSYLSLLGHFGENKPTLISYIIAAFIGVVFMFGLYYLYKLVIKFNHEPSVINLNNCEGTIYNKIDDYKYEVLVKAPDGTHKIEAGTNKDNVYNIGDLVKISKENNQYFIN